MSRESGFWFPSEDAVSEAVRPPKFRRARSCSETHVVGKAALVSAPPQSLLVVFFYLSSLSLLFLPQQELPFVTVVCFNIPWCLSVVSGVKWRHTGFPTLSLVFMARFKDELIFTCLQQYLQVYGVSDRQP